MLTEKGPTGGQTRQSEKVLTIIQMHPLPEIAFKCFVA